MSAPIETVPAPAVEEPKVEAPAVETAPEVKTEEVCQTPYLVCVTPHNPDTCLFQSLDPYH